ncbi:uncharacterized protein LOC119083086 [Bradysia coprophila]|uniref:uncharacterized protein LOC119070632 n=1 Tax=Bradysia coprophila TaxID=38358 RepID=UPI00187DB158|nr:uncharacterized protein LOC119070632 [Bradysia coprophila]XP_037031325.1 uncharacterized protein LOC119070904 [Bradysia coprophila]XP_037047895.1 uncharacterized protein LOC119082483 [Bradysia coprophila]XP_037048600.1 uncharacterized protein LOC119083086 [Bradysia coprophila]
MIIQNLIFVFTFYLTMESAQSSTVADTGVAGGDLNVTDADISVSGTKHCADRPPQSDWTYLGNVGMKHFFLFDNNTLVSWQDAVAICSGKGMYLVKINDKAEMDFVNLQVVTNKIGPVWFGARDLGGRGSYKWTPITAASSYSIGTFVNFSDFLENGPLALQMNLRVSNNLFPAPSYLKTAKPFCQSATTTY